MSMLPFVVPAILDGSAGTNILQTAVQAVSVLVVDDSIPLELHAAEICHNEMQLNTEALHIAILIYRPTRPWQSAPHVGIHQKLAFFCLGLHII